MTVRCCCVIALALMLGCGRIGFDARGDDGCARTPATAQLVSVGVPSDLGLCAGVSWVTFEWDIGARTTVTVTPAAPVESLSLDLLGNDEVRLSGPTWSQSSISAVATLPQNGYQLVRIASDTETTARVLVEDVPRTGRVLHISPDGDDGNEGSQRRPWQTWSFALGQLEPGDTLVVMDGTWTDRASCNGLASPCLAATPLPDADCNSGLAVSGTPAKPITILAQHPRRAHLAGTGERHTMRVAGCASWIVDGLHGESADFPIADRGVVFVFDDVPDFIGRNLLGVHANRCGNVPVIGVGGTTSTGAVIEDSEVYDFHRSGLFTADSQNVTFRRNYVHSRDATDEPCYASGTANRGDVGLHCYFYIDAPSCTFESSIAENVATGYIGGEATTFRVLGSIALDAHFGVLHQSNQMPIVVQTERRHVEDFVCLNCDIGIWNRGLRDEAFNATLVGGRPRADLGYGIGIAVDTFGFGFANSSWKNILAYDNTRVGVEAVGAVAWDISYSTAAGSPTPYSPIDGNIGDDLGPIRRSLTTVPSQIGDVDGSCLVYVPETSNMHGAGENGGDIGANVVFQSIDGELTKRKLWNQRTGAFPCGAIIPGVNDVPGKSCFDVHERLRVGRAGCAIP